MLKADIAEQNAALLTARISLRPGYAFGSHYPSIVISGECTGPDISHLSELEQLVEPIIPAAAAPKAADYPSDTGESDIQFGLRWLLARITDAQTKVGLPVWEDPRVIFANSAGSFSCQIPSTLKSLQPLSKVAQAWLELINLRSASNSPEHALAALREAIERLGIARPIDLNLRNFLKAAVARNISFRQLPTPTRRTIYQYGLGRRSRWMECTISDEDPQIGAYLARHKYEGAAILRHAGIPVPEHVMVHTVEQAEEAAGRLGYPVVVKPANEDGGRGVQAGLANAEQLREAFEKAKAYTSNILVERHFEGKDYRVVVLGNDVIWVIERVPGGVTGNGKDSVAALVEQLNSDPRRGESAKVPLAKIELDDEAGGLLETQGLDVDSVPPPGTFVRLRRTANIGRGGMPVARFDTIHPDNKALAVRAARALRLNLAGVDLLIPDISRSWLETGAAICEVNAGPSFGEITSAHLFPEILDKLLRGDGSIPVTLIVGAPQPKRLAQAISRRLAAHGLNVGYGGLFGAFVGSDQILKGPVAPLTAGFALASDPSVDAIVLTINDFGIVESGLPFDRFDTLILAGRHARVAGDDTEGAFDKAISVLAEMFLPACTGEVVTVPEVKLDAGKYGKSTNAVFLPEPATLDQILQRLVPAMAKRAQAGTRPSAPEAKPMQAGNPADA